MPYLSLARRACLLAFIVMLLAACRGPAAPQPPDPTVPPVPVTPTAAEVPAAPTLTLAPSPTPLPQLDRPIIWYLRGEIPADLLRVNERLNQVLAELRFNAQVELHIVEQSEFNQRMADVLAAGEDWDLVSLSAANYPSWLENNNLLNLAAYSNPLTGQMESPLGMPVPKIVARLPVTAWLAQPGGPYAVPNPSSWVQTPGVYIRADVVSALNLQADLDQAHTFTDLTPLLAKIQAAIADGTLKAGGITDGDKIRWVVGQARLLQPESAGYDSVWGPFAVRFDDPQGKIINWYQSTEFQNLAALRREWQQAGYFPENPLTPDQVIESCQAGRYLVEVGKPVWARSAPEQARRCGYEWIDRPFAPLFLRTDAILSSLTGVNARIAGDFERVHRVMQFLALLHSDPQIYNLLAYGIEGQHWQWADREKQVIAVTAGANYRPDYIEQIGDRSLSYATDPTEAGLWQLTERENVNTPASVALGFTFDPRPVAAQAAAVRGLTPELLDPLASGQAKNVDQAVSALDKALDEAGLGSVQAELEKQWQAWQNAYK